MSRLLKTSAGDLQVVWATEAVVDHFAARWPLPIATQEPRAAAASPENLDATFVVPFSYEGKHLNLVYLPQLPQALPEAERRFARTRELMGTLIQAVWSAGYRGLLLPLATIRRQGAIGVPGIGVAVGPAPEGRPCGTTPGGANPVEVLLEALSAAIEAGFPFEASSRPKSVSSAVAGEVALDFGLCDGLPPICFRPELSPRDPSLVELVGAGLVELVHMPVESTRFPDLGQHLGGGSPGIPLGSTVESVSPFSESPPTPPVQLQEPNLNVTLEHSEERARISSNGARRIYRVLCLVAACDGKVDPSERAILDDFVTRFGIPDDEALLLEAEGRESKRLSVGKNPLERELMFQLMVDVAAADGELHKAERKRLVTFADTLEISRAELRGRLDERFASAKSPVAPPQESGSGSQIGVTAGGTLRASSKGLRRIYRLLWYLANSEGDVGPEEDALLDGYRRRYGISPLEAAQLRREGMRGQGIEISQAPQERALLLEELVAVVAADGEVSGPERRRLEKVTRLLKVPLDELDRLLRERLSVSPEETVEAPSSQSGEWALAGKVILLDVPEGLVSLNLVRVPVGASFRGFHSVPPGVHRFAVLGSQADAVRWVKLDPGEVVVLAFDGSALSEPPHASTARGQAEAGQFESVLQPFVFQLAWKELTDPLAYGVFPPPTFPVPSAPVGSRLALASAEHGGKGSSLLAELAFTFLRGVLDEDPDSIHRYYHLVQAFYHCGEQLPKEDPATFEWVPHLLMAHQRQLPPEALGRESPLVFGSHYLSEDLVDTDVDELVEAGRAWSVFIAGHHLGAPEAQILPTSFRDVEIPEEFVEGLEEATTQIRTIEYAKGRGSELLLPHFSYVSRIREACRDWLGAVAAQSRLVEVSEASKAPAGKLAQGYGRLARLQRECGRARDAAAASAKSQELALEAARRT